MSIVTPVCFWIPFALNIFFHPFTLSLSVSLPVNRVSYSQQNVGSYFLIHSTSLFLLLGKLGLMLGFMFKVNVDFLLVY
jgi:hypothetical protein